MFPIGITTFNDSCVVMIAMVKYSSTFGIAWNWEKIV